MSHEDTYQYEYELTNALAGLLPDLAPGELGMSGCAHCGEPTLDVTNATLCDNGTLDVELSNGLHLTVTVRAAA
jgi:hypothetical protein